MTLIVAVSSDASAVIAADTRLSSNGILIDDISAKAGCLTLFNGRMIYAYSGLATYDRFATREWLLSAMADGIKPWHSANEALLILKASASERFARSDLVKVPPHHKRLSIVFAGYDEAQPVAGILSNFEDLATGTVYPEAQERFFLSCWPGNPAERSWVGYFGNTAIVSEHDASTTESESRG